MKKIYTILLSFLSFAAIAQDGTLVDPTNSQTRQASAALEVYSTNQGFLPPRVALTSTSDATTVTGTEPNGLMVYNTATAGDVTPGYYYWTGSAWSRMLNGATNLSGSGTTNYLARWTPNGNTLGIGATYDNGTNVGISSTSPGAKLDVNGGNVRTTTSGDAKFEFFGSSADRGFVGWQASAPVGVHLLNKDNTPIYFGTTNAERMRIDAVGNVGIGNTNPSGKLHVTGEVIRTNTRVNSNQRYPMAHNGGEDLLGIDPTWSNAELQAYFNSSNVQWSNDATAPSGYAIQITGPVNVGGDYGSGFPYIPIENGASYYMECWIRSSAANVGHYMGSIEYNENMTGGSGNPGSYGYWVMSNSMPGTSWVKVTGTISGFGTAVGQFQTGKKYWTPQALFNYTNGGGATTFISGWKVVKIPSGMTTPSLATNYIQNQTSGDQTAGFRITGNGLFNGGNVGIGTTSPSEKLHIIGNIRGNIAGAIRINTGNGYVDVGPQNTGWSHFQTDRPRFYFNVGGTFDTGQIGSYDEDLSLQTSGTTRISILNSNGNVGINNTSPSVRLHVGGNAFFDLPSGGAALENSLTIKKTGQGQINFGSYPGAWTPALQIQNNDNTDYVWISPLQDGNNARIRTGGSGLDIYTGGAVDAGTFAARFENNGSVGLLNLGVSGNVGSTSDPSNNQGNNWITWGYRSDNNPYYCIRTEYKTYGSYTYSRLQLNWHTGVEIGAHSTYGGTRFFNNSPGVGATQIMSIGDGDNHVRVNNYLFAQYLNSTDNAISSGVTGIMAKQGDNYFRTANAAAVLSFLGVTAPTGDNLGNHTATTYLQMGSQWINFNGGGLYSSSYGNHFWPNDQYYWYMRANRGIYITNNSGTARGYVYHNDGGSFGLLSQDGNWKVRVDNSAIENYNTTYAPFIYDRDNTGYYWDGASTSRSAYWNTGPNDSWFPYTNNWNYFRGNTYAWNATWYDENNSGYFIDPASSSRFYNINTLPGFDNYYPSNNAIRMTPNFHFNTPNGYAFIVNWDNGSSGGTQVLRTTGDGFYVYADGQTFTTNWFRPRGGSGLYFQDYCGGWHMSDGTWIRSYCGKSVYLDRGLATAGTVATQYGASARIYSNWDNATGGGIAIADEGGFYDYNDGWVEFRGSTGISVRTDNTAWDMLFRMYRTDGGGPYDKRVATDANAWGLLGASGNAWWQVWSYNFVNASTRESKRNITPVQSNLMAFIGNELDKITPYFYKYKVETDELQKGNEAKFRPNMHLGLIVDETPDYLLDNTFTGVDVYSVATMGILGAKINRQEIKEIKEAIGMEENTITIQDFGSLKLSGSEQWINFKNKFSSRLGKNDLPVITVTSNKPGVVVSVTEKSEKGFKVVSSDPSVIIDYIAIAEVQVKNNAESENQEISPELMNSLRVDKSKKQLMWNYLEEFKKNQEEAEKQAKIEGEKLKMQRFREMELPADFERPENSPKHDPKANDPDELIRKHNEKLKQQEGGPAPATEPHSKIMEKEAAENLKNYKSIPADTPMKETPPSEPNIENIPR